ncbi:MAG TPA: hypothetical protein VEK10_02625 [Steroidobacteraceae bacterium]|nr:hypothetical protein [Steroidobacteraceae bacterium]
MAVATLRYFTPAGALAAAVRDTTGLMLPEALRARETHPPGMILAWRAPTETLCLTADAARLGALATQLAGMDDGCLVELTGGLKVLRLAGPRTPDLLCRLGGTASVPAPGEARRSRMADVPVLALSLRANETLLVVDRALLPHVLAWIRETLRDLDPD